MDMLWETEANQFARAWIVAWNSHDLDAIMYHDDSNVLLTSPLVRQILNDTFGTVKGSAALRNYFRTGFRAVSEPAL
jgi:ketosteroid isomerase-like protein